MASNGTIQEGDLFTWHGCELVVMSLMMVIGIVGNLLVFYIYHFRWRSTTVTLFKRMLAVLDLVSLILTIPALLYITVSPYSRTFTGSCIFSAYIAVITAIASACVLVIIAVDRFMKLCLLRKTGIGSLLSKKLFCASVVFAIVVNIPSNWIYGRDTVYYYHYNVTVTYCFIHSDSKETVAFYVFSAVLGTIFMTVSTTLIILYYKIVRQLRELSAKHDELKRRPSLAAGAETIKKQKQSEMMRNTAMVFIAVTVVFFASYAPYLVTLVLSIASPNIQTGWGPGLKALYDLARLSPLANNTANPFIYSFTSEHFRQEVKKMLTFKSCEKGFFRRRAFSLSSKSQELSQFSDSREDSVPN